MIKNHKIELKYLVASTGRCGSVYMARLLTSLGINCTHEAIFSFCGLEWAKKVINGKEVLKNSFCSEYDLLHDKPIKKWLTSKDIQAESSYMAVPFLSDEIFKETKIIHLVRNPLSVISSHVIDINFFEPHPKHNLWLDFVLKQMPEIKEIENKIERACYFYVNWNKMIEKINGVLPYIFHKIENKCSDELIDFLGIKKPEVIFENTKINSWQKEKRRLTLEDIPEGKIKKDLVETIERYEYKK